MSEKIKVSVNSWGTHRSLTLSWVDPITGKRKTQSAGTKDWRTAERLAGEKEKELEAGQISPSRVTWEEFQRRYDEEKLLSLKPRTRETALASFRYVKDTLGLEYLAKLTASAMSTFQAKLRASGMKETTIAHHLRNIKAATRWAVRLGMMARAPAIEMPKKVKGKSQARSRAISGEEYERILSTVPKVRPEDADQWTRLLKGLWLSGLRRSEILILSWDQDEPFCLDLDVGLFRIQGEEQKSGKDEDCPVSPLFRDWLLATVPAADRHGLVFRLVQPDGKPFGPCAVGKIVERIGKKAGVKVGVSSKRNKEGKEIKFPIFAGCHSYRRGFGSYWARRVSSQVLKRMMRHASITTTDSYYVTMDAADVAKELQAKYGTPAAPDSSLARQGLQQTCNKPPDESIT